MSSKFFTWTKGDRKHAADLLAAGGVIPIPVECISIKGYDVRRTPQLGTLSHRSSSDTEMRRSPTGFALQDAAVESATSLMAVVNDLLNSPHISAHLSQRASLQPTHGRPRSRTAPTTPRFEAPPTEPVELPGSFPSAVISSRSVFDSNVERKSPGRVCGSGDGSSKKIDLSKPSTERTSIESTTERQRTFSFDREETPAFVIPTKNANRPLLAALQPPAMDHPQLASPARSEEHLSIQSTSTHQDDIELTLLGQISTMRSSHDAHVKSLKCAHDTEVASHLAYIAFLERRQLERVQQSLPSQINAEKQIAQSGGALITEETVAEVEALRRKLSVVRKEQAESADIRTQRDQLRESLDSRERRVLQLKEAARRAKEVDKTLRNTIADLEHRLLQANTQRLDVLEGFHVACDTLSALSKGKPQDELARCVSKSIPGRSPPPTKVRQSTADTTSEELDEVSNKAARLQSVINEQDDKIVSLQKALSARDETEQHNADRLQGLQTRLDEQHASVTYAEGERQRYHTLLQGELRRQARAACRPHSVSPSISAEASTKVKDIILGAKSASGNSEDGKIESIPGLLEKELEYCLSEIILYKLDIKGYRKDLKAARNQVAELQAECSRRSSSSSTSQSSCVSSVHENDCKRNDDGLGISMPDVISTPPKTISTATAEALLAVKATPMDIKTPVHRPRTPMGTHKRLPKPPGFSPSPVIFHTGSPPVQTVTRSDTVESAAGSIIASYTQRATPDLRCAELGTVTSFKTMTNPLLTAK